MEKRSSTFTPDDAADLINYCEDDGIARQIIDIYYKDNAEKLKKVRDIKSMAGSMTSEESANYLRDIYASDNLKNMAPDEMIELSSSYSDKERADELRRDYFDEFRKTLSILQKLS